MNHLYTYIDALQQISGPVQLVQQEMRDRSYREEGMQVVCLEFRYRFSNQVVLQKMIEFDELPESEGPAPALCPECWISYRVLEPSACQIEPSEKKFTSRCQERYWLNAQRAHYGQRRPGRC